MPQQNNKITDEAMKAMAEMLKSIMPEGHGFALMIFEHNKPFTKVSYISDSERNKIGYAMRTLMNKWDEMDRIKRNMNLESDPKALAQKLVDKHVKNYNVKCETCGADNCINNHSCIKCGLQL